LGFISPNRFFWENLLSGPFVTNYKISDFGIQ
jgi:hypothetical protein